MAIDWSVVRIEHVHKAIKRFDLGLERPIQEAVNTFLIFNYQQYPAKFIRGLAYQIATDIKLNPSIDYSGGEETKRFFNKLGFRVEYLGRKIKTRSKRKSLKIGLVSFHLFENEKISKQNTNFVINIINNHSELDLIVFPGWTIYDDNELKKLKSNISNYSSFSFIEVWQADRKRCNPHKAYLLHGHEIIDNEMWQYFTDSKEINNDCEMMEKFLNHLQFHRKFLIKNFIVRWVICGEQNFVMNHQSQKNKVTFRMTENPELNLIFNAIFQETEIFINPAHTIMGNQGKLEMRRKFFSSKNRIYCFTTNNSIKNLRKGNLKKGLLKKSLQYCYFNAKPYPGKLLEHNDNYILRKFEF